MKKIFALISVLMFSLSALTGCGAVKETVDNVTEAMTDASEMISEAAGQMDETGQGDVTDDDGVIGDDDNDNTVSDN